MLTTRSSLLENVQRLENQDAWTEFHTLYAALIFSYAKARQLTDSEASDITSECMQLLVKEMPTFDYDRAKGRFRTWLYRLTGHRILNYLRKKRREQHYEFMEHLIDNTDGPDREWEVRWHNVLMLQSLERVRQRVSPSQFEAFRLYVLEEWPVDRVADHLGITTGQVYTAKARMIRRLTSEMQALDTRYTKHGER